MKVLIVGAGIAGSVAAYFLAKGGDDVEVTVIERAPALRRTGQGIDVRGKGREVIRRMGVEQEILSRTTKELGVDFVDSSNRRLARFDVGDSDDKNNGGRENLVSEIEIMRKDLADILFKAADKLDNVIFRFDCGIKSTSEDEHGVTVKFTAGHDDERFDLVIGADGVNSKTRELMLGPEMSKVCIRSLDTTVAFFSIPAQPADKGRSRWYNLPGRRCVYVRPKTSEESSAYLTVLKDSPEIQAALKSGDINRQKQAVADLFGGGKDQPTPPSWEIPRLLDAMWKTEDFYFASIAQIRMPSSASWHKGRMCLIGDASSCPSPFTGLGTTVAILSAYVLAVEVINEHQRQKKNVRPSSTTTTGFDHEKAFTAYSTKFGPYVEKAQSIPLGGYLPWLVNPETKLGIWFMSWILWTVDRLSIPSLLTRFVSPPADEFDLPNFR